MEILLATALGALVAGIAYFLARMERRVDDTNKIVRQQLRPNGGDSIYDRVTSIERRLVDGAHQMDGLDARLQNIERRDNA